MTLTAHECGRFGRLVGGLGVGAQRFDIRPGDRGALDAPRPDPPLYEVFKKVAQQRGEDEGLRIVAVMEQGRVKDLDRATALEAARLSRMHGIAMADSVMLATASRHHATLWTQDQDFCNIPGVRFFAKSQ